MAPKLVTDENDSPIGLTDDSLPAGYMIGLVPIHDRHKIAEDDEATDDAGATDDQAAKAAADKKGKQTDAH